MVKGKSTNSIFCGTTAPPPPVDGMQVYLRLPPPPRILLGFWPFADVLRHPWAEWGGVTKDICLKTQQNRPYKGLNLALSILTPEC